MPIDGVTIELLLALAAVAFAAGFVDAVAGGGGLLTLPALLLAGLSPAEAVATNKLQGTFGVAVSSYGFWRAGHLRVAELRPLILLTAVGASLGSLTVSYIAADWLEAVIPFVLLGVALYFLIGPRAEAGVSRPVAAPLLLAAAVALPVGFYDGLLGPGAGSFYLIGLLVLGGHALVSATATTKVLNLTSNCVALFVFLATGHVVFWLGLPMALGQSAGARLGVAAVMKHGDTLIRPLVVLVSIAMAIRLLMPKAASWIALLGIK